jgi:hypothetical protein
MFHKNTNHNTGRNFFFQGRVAIPAFHNWRHKSHQPGRDLRQLKTKAAQRKRPIRIFETLWDDVLCNDFMPR